MFILARMFDAMKMEVFTFYHCHHPCGILVDDADSDCDENNYDDEKMIMVVMIVVR